MAVKVLRLLEYTYESFEQADGDMARWVIPPDGLKAFGSTKMIRSSVIVRPAVDGERERWSSMDE